MRGFIFSFEAFISLLALLLVIASLPSPPHASFENVYRFQLVQDFLETSMKNPAKLDAVKAFASGDVSARQYLEGRYLEELRAFGLECMEVRARNHFLRVGCDGGEGVKVVGSRVISGGDGFFNLEIALFFQ